MNRRHFGKASFACVALPSISDFLRAENGWNFAYPDDYREVVVCCADELDGLKWAVQLQLRRLYDAGFTTAVVSEELASKPFRRRRHMRSVRVPIAECERMRRRVERAYAGAKR